MSNELGTHTIETVGSAGPTVEESLKALEEKGIVPSEDGTVTETNKDPGAEKDAFAKFRNEDGEIDTEKLMQSYSELEKKQSTSKPQDEDEDGSTSQEDETSPTTSPEEIQAVTTILDKAGLDLKELSETYWSNDGKLNDEHYEAFEKIGYTRDLVDTYMAGKGANAQNTMSAALEAVGGADAYDEMTDWLIANSSDEELDEFEADVTSEKRSQVLKAVRALKARYEAENPDQTEEPQNLITPNGGPTGGEGYANNDEYLEDLSDPRYAESASFRARVRAKLEKSNF